MIDRLNELLAFAAERAPFQRSRLTRPAARLARGAVAAARVQQGRSARRPGGEPAVRHQPDRSRSSASRTCTRRAGRRRDAAHPLDTTRTGRGGDAASAACSRRPGSAPATASRWRTRSARTCSSGRPTRACWSVGARVIALGGMDSVQRLLAIRDYAATTLLATPTYALHLAQVAGPARALRRAHHRRADRLRGRAGRSRSRPPGSGSRPSWDARCLDHAGLTEVGAFTYPCAAAGGLHLREDEFIVELLRAGVVQAGAGRRAGRARGHRAGSPWLPGDPLSHR